MSIKRRKFVESTVTLIRRLVREEDGPTAVEYAVMLTLILLACIGSVELS